MPVSICISSLEKYLFSSSARFLIRLAFFFVIKLYELFGILEIKILSVTPFAKFCPTLQAVFLFCLWISFAIQELVSLNRFHLFIFVFIFLI